VQAHITSDNGERKRVEVSAMSALDWYPIAFIVIVREDRDSKPGRLLFVYADDEKDCEMDKFFFQGRGQLHDALEPKLWRRVFG
jgi:hypothetical protein